MYRRIFITLGLIAVSFLILFISITQTAQVRYSFNEKLTGSPRVLGDEAQVEYYFPYSGRIQPDHPLWFLKAMRDRAWLLVTPKAERKAELNLLFANKRLVSSKMLFERDKPELAFMVLTKAEKYLENSLEEEEKARSSSVDTKSFLYQLSLASLKHIEVIREITDIAPDDAKPEIIKMENYAQSIYQESKNNLHESGMIPPKDPTPKS